jgi:hypothetical protein
MSNEKGELKPLSFFNETKETENNFNNEQIIENIDNFVPISGDTKTEIKNSKSNFVCLFGTAQSGKSVILCSLLYYLKARGGVLRPATSTPNSKDANVLLETFFDDISRGILPLRTTIDQIARFDFTFEPNNKSKKIIPINLTFLDTAGDNNTEIRNGGKLNSTLEEYINSNIPITFIVVTSWDNAHKEDTFINTFFEELERTGKKLKNINIAVVITKWDLSGKNQASPEEVEHYFNQRIPMTNNFIKTYNLTRTYYTIGNVDMQNNKVTKLELDRATVLGNWLYESIVGYPIDYEGTFWEKIKFSILG